jgi:hypothetical protein
LTERSRFRISLSQREVEIEGSEAFVERHAERIEELLALFDGGGDVQPAAPAVAESPAAAVPLGPFGEFIQRLPSAATEVDRMLAAGFWVQNHSNDDAFATGDASRLLAEHGHRIGNPSQCVRQSLMAKRVFIIARGRYRVSQGGRAHLRQLMGPVLSLEAVPRPSS